jgi:hypothetical protein
MTGPLGPLIVEQALAASFGQQIPPHTMPLSQHNPSTQPTSQQSASVVQVDLHSMQVLVAWS